MRRVLCILCGRLKRPERFPLLSRTRDAAHPLYGVRDKACSECVERIDAPLTEAEKAEARKRNAKRYKLRERRDGVLANCRQRNVPVPPWWAEAFAVDPLCTHDPSKPSRAFMRNERGQIVGEGVPGD